MRVEPLQRVDILVGCSVEETVVHTTVFCTESEFFFKTFVGRGLWHSVWHFHHRCHTTRSSRSAFGGDVSLVGETWLTEVHMVVDDSREEVEVGGIHHMIEVFSLFHCSFHHVDDELAIDDHGTNELATFVDDCCVVDKS